MKRRRADANIATPSDLVASELKIGGQRFAILSFPIEARADGQFDSLTGAEREVVALVLAGKSNAAIADARQTSARTVANQIASILKKLGAKSRRELITLFYGK